MTTRKRKSPERKPARKEPGFLSMAASASFRLIARYPLKTGGVFAFCVVFGFVAANAFWYQPGQHPSPFLRTRDPHNFTALLGLNRSGVLKPDPQDVTTFRIQRDTGEKIGTAQQAVAQTTLQNTSSQNAAPQEEQAALRLSVQKELARLQLYRGPVDGSSNAATEAAIRGYEARIGLPVTGLPSDDLLAALSLDTLSPVTPKDRPVAVVAEDKAIDPVAAAIRSAEKTIVTAPAPTKISARPAAAEVKNAAATPQRISAPASAPLPPGTVGGATQVSMIMDIQRGLANIAYTNVTVDGVAGEQTKAAIRHFERHYRLPETGEPNPAVLAKLKAIGAL
ncbi:peptidoglycan-binding domain-containing protein [Rhizobium paknamense]|uniref:Peptidoglycan hydrolase-like protein with peptidoglycan-binding domain n=1 Tax=Rhizobium paknamense TaxID=1206817 RepID=A0ABU0I7V4_9HYPH|nr:peptidoglycan-binding domain-containing protein [Rhizobium paknamense]MDQ0454315.1 peptidoglycan hydrolase-like protein with peptidoglycan-binding domain [Rhizobium paknamense]